MVLQFRTLVCILKLCWWLCIDTEIYSWCSKWKKFYNSMHSLFPLKKIKIEIDLSLSLTSSLSPPSLCLYTQSNHRYWIKNMYANNGHTWTLELHFLKLFSHLSIHYNFSKENIHYFCDIKKTKWANPLLVESLGFSLKCFSILKNLCDIFLYLLATTHHWKLYPRTENLPYKWRQRSNFK